MPIDKDSKEVCLPPWGGSGLKSVEMLEEITQERSPSLGREWIEMTIKKSPTDKPQSPSLGREWIEICGNARGDHSETQVSLLGEGVD